MIPFGLANFERESGCQSGQGGRFACSLKGWLITVRRAHQVRKVSLNAKHSRKAAGLIARNVSYFKAQFQAKHVGEAC